MIGYNLYAYCDNSPLGAVDYDGHFAIAIAAGVTVSVGFILSVAAVGALAYKVYDYSQNPYNEQNPVAVLGNMLSDQIGSIRNAKNKKKGEKAGKKGETDKDIHNPDSLGDADVNDLQRVPDSVIKELGGEDFTREIKKNTGKSKSDLYWDKDGNIYSIPKGGGAPQHVITITR